MKKYKTEYRLIRWKSPEQFVEELKRAGDDGFRNDLTRLYHADGEEGWTIFTKTYEVRPSINDALIPLSEVWSAINRHGFANGYDSPDPEVKALSDDIRAWYDRTFPAYMDQSIT